MAKMQRIDLFLNKALGDKTRPILTMYNKTPKNIVACDGQRLHLDTAENDYIMGLNETKISKKYDLSPSGKYPDTDFIIAESVKHSGITFDIDPNLFLQAVKIAKVFTKKSGYGVKLGLTSPILDKLQLTIAGNDPETGNAMTCIDIINFNHTMDISKYGYVIKLMYQAFQVALNGTYLTDMLDGLKHNDLISVQLSMGNPAIFTADTRQVIIMPMSL